MANPARDSPARSRTPGGTTRHTEHRHVHTRDARYASCFPGKTVLAEMGGALDSQNCSSRRSCRGQRRNPALTMRILACSPPNRMRSSTNPRAAPLQRRIKGAEVTVCFVLHRVADYDAWRRVYDRVPTFNANLG